MLDTNEISTVQEAHWQGIIETGRKGKELTFCGGFKGQDSVGGFLQPFVVGDMNLKGEIQFAGYYPDQNIFQVTPSIGFGVAYDGNDRYYLAGGSNNTELMMCVDTTGKLIWANQTNHHDFYSVIFLSHNNIMLLGQDESYVGTHDYSLVRLDSSGAVQNAMMYGTEYFDQPEQVIETDSGFVMGGWSNFNFIRSASIIRVDDNFNQMWAYTYGRGNVNYVGIGVAEAADGSGYYSAGYVMRGAQGTYDSLFVMKVDRNGSLKWIKRYQTNPVAHLTPSAIQVDPDSGYIYVAGSYQPGMFRQPFVVKMNDTGNVIWGRNYGYNDTLTEELFHDIALLGSDEQFVAVGEILDYSSSPTGVGFLAVKADRDSGNTGCDSILTFTVHEDSAVAGGTFYQESVTGFAPYLFFEGLVGMNETVECMSTEIGDTLVTRREWLPASAWRMRNPSYGSLELHLPQEWQGQSMEVVISDLLGRKVWAQKIGQVQQKVMIDLGGLPAGQYLVSPTIQGRRHRAKKLIIIK